MDTLSTISCPPYQSNEYFVIGSTWQLKYLCVFMKTFVVPLYPTLGPMSHLQQTPWLLIYFRPYYRCLNNYLLQCYRIKVC